jgi:hypothetical protein
VTARKWLAENGYADVVELIEEVEQRWKAEGVSTRRNWWDILSGGHDGQRRAVSGIEFPVLAVAQIHEGKPVTAGALRRGRNETPPNKEYRGRSARGKRTRSVA